MDSMHLFFFLVGSLLQIVAPMPSGYLQGVTPDPVSMFDPTTYRPACYEGTRRADPSNPNRYLWCVHGQYYLQSCPDGTTFCSPDTGCCNLGRSDNSEILDFLHTAHATLQSLHNLQTIHRNLGKLHGLLRPGSVYPLDTDSPDTTESEVIPDSEALVTEDTDSLIPRSTSGEASTVALESEEENQETVGTDGEDTMEDNAVETSSSSGDGVDAASEETESDSDDDGASSTTTTTTTTTTSSPPTSSTTDTIGNANDGGTDDMPEETEEVDGEAESQDVMGTDTLMPVLPLPDSMTAAFSMTELMTRMMTAIAAQANSMADNSSDEELEDVGYDVEDEGDEEDDDERGEGENVVDEEEDDAGEYDVSGNDGDEEDEGQNDGTESIISGHDGDIEQPDEVNFDENSDDEATEIADRGDDTSSNENENEEDNDGEGTDDMMDDMQSEDKMSGNLPMIRTRAVEQPIPLMGVMSPDTADAEVIEGVPISLDVFPRTETKHNFGFGPRNYRINIVFDVKHDHKK